LLLAIGDREAYKAVCRQMLDQFRATANPVAARRTCLACLISSQPVGEINELVRLAELVVEHPDEVNLAYRERALAAYRAGDWNAAKQWSEKGRLARWSFESESQNQLIEAMALRQLGKADEAKATYGQAVELMRRGFPNAPASFGFGLDWNEWLYFELLRRETAALLDSSLTKELQLQ
jgi:tetratricopeptide (TPR) repeat protein